VICFFFKPNIIGEEESSIKKKKKDEVLYPFSIHTYNKSNESNNSFHDDIEFNLSNIYKNQ
jgi:predicted adenine nucleotide alpha hydrolase (AANH) superfamily ATPase